MLECKFKQPNNNAEENLNTLSASNSTIAQVSKAGKESMSVQQSKGKSSVRGSEAVQRHLQASNYYEALQLCRAIGSRLTAQKKFPELLAFLEDMIVTFAEAGKASSVEDLAKMFTNVLLEDQRPDDESTLEKVKAVFSAFKPRADFAPDRQQFLNHLITWSKKVRPQYARGSPALHECIAEIYVLENNTAAAIRHFELSQNGPRFGQYLAEHQDKYGIESEADLTVAQAVLQCLCLDEKNIAIDLFDSYMQHHPKLRKNGVAPPFSSPLLDFIFLLLRAVAKNRLNLYTALVEAYKPSIDRDPMFNEYLEKIAQINFASCPLSSRLPSFLNTVLNSIFADGDLEDARETRPKPSGSTQSDQPSGSATANQNGTGSSTSAAIMSDEDLD